MRPPRAAPGLTWYSRCAVREVSASVVVWWCGTLAPSTVRNWGPRRLDENVAWAGRSFRRGTSSSRFLVVPSSTAAPHTGTASTSCPFLKQPEAGQGRCKASSPFSYVAPALLPSCQVRYLGRYLGCEAPRRGGRQPPCVHVRRSLSEVASVTTLANQPLLRVGTRNNCDDINGPEQEGILALRPSGHQLQTPLAAIDLAQPPVVSSSCGYRCGYNSGQALKAHVRNRPLPSLFGTWSQCPCFPPRHRAAHASRQGSAHPPAALGHATVTSVERLAAISTDRTRNGGPAAGRNGSNGSGDQSMAVVMSVRRIAQVELIPRRHHKYAAVVSSCSIRSSTYTNGVYCA